MAEQAYDAAKRETSYGDILKFDIARSQPCLGRPLISAHIVEAKVNAFGNLLRAWGISSLSI
jgi:hypothetical protein